ncbi:MAG: glycosyltransferase family 2 protein [Gemmataceae bacterium]|nr:glycosyltransferase family 2 protein [Gemmataceae bacterium]
MDQRKLITLCVPVLNEEANLPKLYAAVQQLRHELADRYRFELLFTDNHSTDGTFAYLSELAQRDPMVRVLRFSRNFGFQRSVLCGYLNARGDAVIQLDGDLQDPPALIPRLLELWEAGNQVVYGVRVKRQEGWLITLIRRCFYRLLRSLSEHDLPLDAGDFRLVDRRVVEELGKIDDATPYVRGTIAMMGFNQVGVPYERAARQEGESKFRFKDLVGLGLDGIFNHSFVPLRLATYCSLAIALATLLLIGAYVVGRLFLGHSWPPGFATVVVLNLISISLNGLFFGILGEYVARIYRQVKKSPLTIIEKELNNQPQVDSGSVSQQRAA